MRRFNPRSLNHWLLVAAAVALAAGWLAGYWTLGAGIGFTALCFVGARAHRQQVANQSLAAAVPVPVAAPKQLDGSVVDQLIAQARAALLLRPKIATTLTAADREAAQNSLDDSMAMVPTGEVAMYPRLNEGADEIVSPENLIAVEGLFLDR